MYLEVITAIGLVLVGLTVFLIINKYRTGNKKIILSTKDKEFLSSEIEQGILYEDQFVNIYYNMLRNEGYMFAFGGHKNQAHNLLFKMVEESKAHKASLMNIKKQLGL